MRGKKDLAIKFKNVNKTYKLFKNEKERLKATFSFDPKYVQKHAVSNISFEIEKGESVALFGHNGAGKSTVLKMITGVSHPNGGIIRVNGRVSALLELTAGFNLDMTGVENIYFRGELLGMTTEEVKKVEQDIIDFADLGVYIDRPVRTYSSGMKARLGFALNINIKPEILIVDEALSVGDAVFQKKCRDKVDELVKEGVTFLFVTHSTASAKKFCKRGIVLKKGHIIFDGKIDDAVKVYNDIIKR